MEVIVPIFILHPDHQRWLDHPDEFSDIAFLIKREIANKIYAIIILTYLITRRGEEGKDKYMVRMLLSYFVNQRSRLLELSEGCTVYPYLFAMGTYYIVA